MDRQEACGRRSEVSDQPMSATADDRRADMLGDEFRGRSDGDRRAMRQEKSKLWCWRSKPGSNSSSHASPARRRSPKTGSLLAWRHHAVITEAVST
jgi:hypothetical protein